MGFTQLQKRQLFTFVLVWISYASTYLLRKPLGVIKADLKTELWYTKSMLGWLDAALLLPYAVMQILLAPIGDKFGSRHTLAISLLISALSMITFANYDEFHIFLILLFLNGTAQAQCWPNCVKALGAWYPDDRRNSVFGMFGTSTFAGGVIATMLAVHLQSTYGWRNVFFAPSCILIGISVVVFFMLKTPEDLNIDVPGKALQIDSQETPKKLSYFEIVKIPGVLECSLIVMCLKVVRYCMYMWLPLYLLDELKYAKTNAGVFSVVFEVGGVCGSAVIGIVIDKYYKGHALRGITTLCLFSTLTLLMFQITNRWGFAFNFLFLALAGASNCAPDAVLTGSIPTQLGEMNGRNAAASVSGFINGFGTIGTFMEGPIIGVILEYFGWTGVLYFMVALSAVATISSFQGAIKLAKIQSSEPSYTIVDSKA